LKTAALEISKDFFIYILLCAGTFGMLLTISQYLTFNNNIGFLQFKQDYININIWRIAFYTHVFSSIFILSAGFTQFSNYILKHQKKLHKIAGKIYVYNILLINFPAGMIMAVYANGLLPSKIAFVILDCLWFLFTLKAVMAIKKKDVATHKKYMIRSYALTFSAITLRVWKIILLNSFHIEPLTLYMIDAWMGFVPNLLLAEWIIRKKKI
jgi:uncharacterized membrane protein YozB (DUF420 family)